MEVTIPAKPEPVTLDIARAALVVVDMQNSFAKKGGMMDHFGKLDAAMAERVIAADKMLIGAFRKKGIKIVYLRMTYNAADAANAESPFYWKEHGLKAARANPELKGRFLTQGTWDREIVDELKPEEQDTVIDKSRFSGFVNTGLDAGLKALNIKYLFFIGLFTNICVESTARDAFSHEYFPILIEDACGNMGPDFIREATAWNIAAAFGWVAAGGDVIKALG